MKNVPLSFFLLKNIATLGFIGYLPKAPGTWGSLAGLAVLLISHLSLSSHVILTVATIAVGIIAADRAEKIMGEKDSKHIVIDEVAGILVSSFHIPQTLPYLVSAFLLFRFFDILKPFPVNRMERSFHGGTGVMADDIAAGIFANLCIQVWTKIF